MQFPETPSAADEISARLWLKQQSLAALSLMMMRGAAGRCPACGKARLFDGYVAVRRICPTCLAPLGRVPADDAPPYFTIFITAHLMIALILVVGRYTDFPVWAVVACFLCLALATALLLLRPIKGATVGAMLKLGLVDAHHEAERPRTKFEARGKPLDED